MDRPAQSHIHPSIHARQIVYQLHHSMPVPKTEPRGAQARGPLSLSQQLFQAQFAIPAELAAAVASCGPALVSTCTREREWLGTRLESMLQAEIKQRDGVSEHTLHTAESSQQESSIEFRLRAGHD